MGRVLPPCRIGRMRARCRSARQRIKGVPMLHNLILAYSVLAVALGSFTRAYGGFGFALVALPALSLVWAPSAIVPVILMLDVLIGSVLLVQTWRVIRWRAVSLLWLGAALGSPAGAHLLANLPVRPMRMAIALSVLIFVVLYKRGFALKKVPNPWALAALGLVSGFCNGSAAMGGPPVVLLYLSLPDEIATSRGSLNAYFLGIDLLALSLAGWNGLIGFSTLTLFGWMVPGLLVGAVLGSRSFWASSPEVFRARVLLLLAAISCVTLLRAAV